MKLKNQTVEIWGECPVDFEQSVLWIENCGRICYRSEDKIVKGSGLKFVNGIWRRKHFSVIEQSNVVLRTITKQTNPNKTLNSLKLLFDSKYFEFIISGDYVYIAGNWRVWIEWFYSKGMYNVTLDNFFEYLNDIPDTIIIDTHNDIPVSLKRVTAIWNTDRSVSHEIVRHRPASFSQESQRYCRYGELTFIKPFWYDKSTKESQSRFIESLEMIEEDYKFLLSDGLKAEEARAILPNATATKIVITASILEWNHIFNLRCSGAAYQGIRELSNIMKNEFMKEGWII